MAKRCFPSKKKQRNRKRCSNAESERFLYTITLVYFPAKETHYAVCVGKKYGKSVERNRIKRLLREAFAEYGSQIKPCRALLIPKIAKEYKYAFFKRDLKKIIEKENLFMD